MIGSVFLVVIIEKRREEMRREKMRWEGKRRDGKWREEMRRGEKLYHAYFTQ